MHADGPPSRLLFKKRMFRETDEAISEPIFVSLSFVQAQHDYLQARLLPPGAPLGSCCAHAMFTNDLPVQAIGVSLLFRFDHRSVRVLVWLCHRESMFLCSVSGTTTQLVCNGATKPRRRRCFVPM